MCFWLAVGIGAFVAMAAVEGGFFATWIWCVNLLFAAYLAITLAPTMAVQVPSAIETSLGYALLVVALGVAWMLLSYGVCFLCLSGDFNLPFAKAFDTLGAAILGFLSGFFLAGFLGLAFNMTPWSEGDWARTYGFDRKAQKTTTDFVCACCDAVHGLVGADQVSTRESLAQLFEAADALSGHHAPAEGSAPAAKSPTPPAEPPVPSPPEPVSVPKWRQQGMKAVDGSQP